MTDLMEMLYNHILESRLPRYIEHAQFKLEQLRAERLFEKLASALPEPELRTFEKYQDTLANLYSMETEAMFQAAWRAFRELA